MEINNTPAQITWQAILRQRMYDFLNVHTAHDASDTERGEQIIELAVKDLSSYLS